MNDVRISGAMNAYSNAMKVADRILRETSAPTAEPQQKVAQADFGDLVGNALRSAASSGYKSEAVSTRALAGKADITDVVTAVANAEMALNTVVAVRDRVISAYQDIIKMPI